MTAPADLAERLAELENWLNDCAVNLQNVAAKGVAECPGAHPCECWHFAEDGRRKVEALLAKARANERATCYQIAQSSLYGWQAAERIHALDHQAEADD